MNGWNCNQLGAGGGWPGVPGAGTAITTPATISAWQASVRDDEHLGPRVPDRRRQRRARANPPYTAGLFNGNPVAGRPCARYYRHFHSEQGKWITGTGTKYDNNYISAVAYTELDIKYAYAQSDLCWLLDGLWMSGGGPSIGLQGAGDPNPGQGKNRLMAADVIERWQDQRARRSTSRTSVPNDQGTQVANVGDNNGPGAATYPFGAVPYDFSQDTTPFQQIFERLRHPERHEYLFERDGQSAHGHAATRTGRSSTSRSATCTTTSQLDRTRGAQAVRRSRSPTPTGRRSQVTAIGQRPPETPAPRARRARRSSRAAARSATRVEVTDLGVWARFSEKPRNYNYIWLRDGAPMAKYNGAPIGDRGRPVHGRRRADLHAHRRRRRPRDQLPGHGAEPEVRPGQRGLAVHQRDHGRGQAAARHARRSAPGSSTLSAGLPEAYQADVQRRRARSTSSRSTSRRARPPTGWSRASTPTTTTIPTCCWPPARSGSAASARAAGRRVDIGSVKLAKDTKYWIAVLGVGGNLNVRNYDGANGFSPSETYKRTKGDAAELPTAWKTGTVYPHDGPLTAAGG